MSLYAIKKKLDVLYLFQKSTNAMKVMALSSRNQVKKILTEKYIQIDQINFFMTLIFEKKYIKKYTSNSSVEIFIGEERGFCGNFSQEIFKVYLTSNMINTKSIVIGKTFNKKLKNIKRPDLFIDNFKIKTIEKTLEEIYSYIQSNHINEIIIYHMQAKSLSENHMQKITINMNHDFYHLKKNSYTGHFSEFHILEYQLKKYLNTMLHTILLESLYCEQSARYIAMDSALKNTEENIEEYKKLYFKIRQKKINSELGDVIINLM